MANLFDLEVVHRQLLPLLVNQAHRKPTAKLPSEKHKKANADLIHSLKNFFIKETFLVHASFKNISIIIFQSNSHQYEKQLTH